MYNGVHDATCPNYICPDCGTGPWHEECPKSEEPPTEEPTEPQKHPDLGKMVKFATTWPWAYKSPTNFNDGRQLNVDKFPKVMRVAEVFEVGTSVIYKLETGDGSSWPEAFDGYFYIESTKVTAAVKCSNCDEYECDIDHSATEPTIPEPSEPEDKCDKCDDPECDGTKHVQCEICNAYDCIKIHFWCARCEKYDCGASHTICPVPDCGAVDCTTKHTFCAHCGIYDCGETHEDEYKPDTAPVIPSNPTLIPGEDVTIVDEYGDALTDGLILFDGEKTSISAWATEETGVTYQWQVRYNSANDLWININGETGKGMLVSPAMFLNIINSQGSTAVRCVMIRGEQSLISDAIPVIIDEAVPRVAMFGNRSGDENNAAPAAEGTEYSIIIEYRFRDEKPAATSWTANLTMGADYILDVVSPTVMGYKPTQTRVTMDFRDFSGCDPIIIYYDPDIVNFTVVHHQQNVSGGGYTIKDTNTKSGYTGATVGLGLGTTYPGFDALRYDDSLIIAADGSTVVNIYYDRQYYMLALDLNGGYGAEPLFTRYGTPVNFADPQRKGYTFAGWDPALPATVIKNTSHTAQWTQSETGFTVAFWYEDANRNPNTGNYEYTFVASESGTAVTGTEVKGADYKGLAFAGRDDQHFTYSHATSAIVEADGSTVVNVYFTRASYKLTYLKWQCLHNHTSGCTYCNEGKVNHTHSHDECCKVGWHLWHEYKGCPYGYEHTHSASCCTHTAKLGCSCTKTDAGWYVSDSATFKYQEDVSAFHAKQGAERWTPKTGSGFASNAEGLYGAGLAVGTFASMHGCDVTFYQSSTGDNQYYFTYWLETYDGSGSRNYNGHNFAQGATFTPKMGAVGYKGDYQSGRPFGFADFEAWGSDSLGGNNVAQLKAPDGSFGSQYTYFNFYYIRTSHPLTYFNKDVELTQFATTMMYDQPLNSTHNLSGDLLVSPYGDGYFFDGWFLDDECTVEAHFKGAEKMPMGGMALFAKWSPRKYTVNTYKTQGGTKISTYNITNGEAYTGTVPKPTNGNLDFVGWFYVDAITGEEKAYDFSMPVYRDMELYAKWTSDKMGVGTITYIDRDTGLVLADPTPIQGLLGANKTYDAKIGTELKYSGYFPETPSHSIEFSENENNNNYIFYYKAMDEVGYEVHYVNKETGKPMSGVTPETGTTRDPMLTFLSKTIKGYSVDAIEKTLIVSSDPKLNVVTFYYTEDNVHAPVQVIHYTQPIDGSTNPEDYTKYLTETPYQGVISQVQTAKALTIAGFTYNGEISQNNITLTDEGLLLKLYYDRNTYQYEFRFEDNKDPAKTLKESVKGSGLYGVRVDYPAPEIPGYKITTAGSEVIIISDSNAANVKTFVYAEQEVTINYQLGTGGGGTVSPESETVMAVTGTATGSTATAISTDYRFNGWYTDFSCSSSNWVSNDETFKPGKNANDVYEDITYFAKFDEINVTIKYEVVMPESAEEKAILTVESEQVRIFSGRTVGSSVSVIPTNYEFDGWYSDAACTNKLSNSESYAPPRPEKWVDGTTFYAKFVEKQAVINYKVVGGFGTVSRSYEYVDMVTGKAQGATAEAIDHVSTFVAWYSDEACTNKVSDEVEFTPKTNGIWAENLTYYAKFDPIPYTVTFKNGETTVGTDSYTCGGKLNFPENVVNDNAILTWTVKESDGTWEVGTEVNSDTIVEWYGDVTLVANWTIHVIWIDWNFTFSNMEQGTLLDVDPNVPYNGEYTYDNTLPTRTADEKYTYTFVNEADNWERVDLSKLTDLSDDMREMLRNVIVFRAVYDQTPIDYKITYELNGGELPQEITNPQLYNADTETFDLPEPMKQGYKFMGWATDENATTGETKVTIETGTTGDMTFYATWELALVDLTINLSNPKGDQSYIYEVTMAGESSFGTIQVVLNSGNSYSAKIISVPVGTYVIKEVGTWSWRISAIEELTVELTQSETVTVGGGSVVNPYWLSGNSYDNRKKGGNSNG